LAGFEVITEGMMTLFSFVLVRQSTQPLSDICYFGASTFCILFLQREEQALKNRFWRLLLIALLVAVCIQLRTIGIALIPAFLWVTVRGMEGISTAWQWTKRNRVIWILTPIAAGMTFVAAAHVIRHSPYGVAGVVVSNVLDHSQEWGELTVNIPASKLPGPFVVVLRSIGVLAIGLCAIGSCQRRSSVTAVEVYLLVFALLVFAYPWFDTRLWLPVIPLLMFYVLLGLKRITGPLLVRPLVWGYCVVFALFGVLALGYSTRLTFAGTKFADLYGDGRLRSTYKIALGEPTGNPGAVDADALYLLRRYH
jgi:hypothetical protein